MSLATSATATAQSLEAALALALVSRSATEAAAIAILKRPAVERTQADHHAVLNWILGEHPKLFHEFSASSVRELSSKLQYAAFARREIVFEQGAPADAMYVLLRGAVTMWHLPLPEPPPEVLTPVTSPSPARSRRQSRKTRDDGDDSPGKGTSPAVSCASSRRNSLSKRASSNVTNVPEQQNEPSSSCTSSGSNSVRSTSPRLGSPHLLRTPPAQSRAIMRQSRGKMHSPPLMPQSDAPTSNSTPGTAARAVPPLHLHEASPPGLVAPVPQSVVANPLYIKRTARSEAKDHLLEPPPLPPHLVSLAQKRGVESWRAKYQLLGTLRAGGPKVIFGEMGLLTVGASRSATIRAEDMPTETLTVAKADFEAILKNSYHREINEKYSSICKIQLFQRPVAKTAATTDNAAETPNDDSGPPASPTAAPGLADNSAAVASLKKLALYFEHRVVPARGTIVTQHSPATSVYCIVSGEVEVLHQLVPQVPEPLDESSGAASSTSANPVSGGKRHETFAGKLAGGYGATSKLERRAEEGQKSSRRREAPTVPLPSTPARSVLMCVLSAGQTFGELDHLTSVGGGKHPFGLRAVGATTMLVMSREDWQKRVLNGLLDRATIRKMKARDHWRLNRARSMDERGQSLAAMLHTANPWRSHKHAHALMVHGSADPSPSLPRAPSSGHQANIVSPSGQAGWQSIRDLGEVALHESLASESTIPTTPQTARTFGSSPCPASITSPHSTRTRGTLVASPGEDILGFSRSFPSLSSPRTTRQLVSPSPSTARLIHAHRASQANLALAGSPSTAALPTRASAAATGAIEEQKDPSSVPTGLSVSASSASLVTPLAPLPASLAVGRELGASKSLRELEVDRAAARRREDALNAPRPSPARTRVSRYAKDVYVAPTTHRVRRFRANYDTPLAHAQPPQATTNLTPRALLQQDAPEPLPEPFAMHES